MIRRKELQKNQTRTNSNSVPKSWNPSATHLWRSLSQSFIFFDSSSRSCSSFICMLSIFCLIHHPLVFIITLALQDNILKSSQSWTRRWKTWIIVWGIFVVFTYFSSFFVWHTLNLVVVMVHIVSFGCLLLIKVMVLHCYLVAIILIVVVDKKMFRVLVFDSILKETCPGFYMTVFYYCLYRP
jgi:hypothetical protein